MRIAVLFITHQFVQAFTVGDHFAAPIRGAKATDFRKDEQPRGKFTDLLAGGHQMTEWEGQIERFMATHDPHRTQITA